MIVGIDFENTLFPTLSEAIKLYNVKHNSTLEYEQITAYNLYECIDDDMVDELIDTHNGHAIYEAIKPFQNAVSAIKRLIGSGNEVFILSDADASIFTLQEEAVQKYFPFIPSEHVVRICRKEFFKMDILIDDNVENLKGHIYDRILFDCPYNRDSKIYDVYGIHRMSNWNELMDIVNKINNGE